MTAKTHRSTEYYNQQYNARAMIPEHPSILTRWAQDSALARRTNAGLFNLPYGESADERLDFFPTKRHDAPLMVFIHGGWWRALDKSDFSFIAPPYTNAGINVALLNYTLAPGASIADIVMQQVRAMAWLYRNAEKFQFDPKRIVIAGHSAGAHLSAMMLAAVWPAYAPDLPLDMIKAGFLLSGLYDLAPVQHAPFVNVDLKLTANNVDRISPALMPQSHATPFMTAVGGLESDEFRRQNALIGKAWERNHLGDLAMPEANHLTICDAFATPGHRLFETVAKSVSLIR